MDYYFTFFIGIIFFLCSLHTVMESFKTGTYRNRPLLVLRTRKITETETKIILFLKNRTGIETVKIIRFQPLKKTTIFDDPLNEK